MLREMSAVSTALLIGSANAAQACSADPLLQPLEVVFVSGAAGAALLLLFTAALAVANVWPGSHAQTAE